jgi:hypothetical protein
MTYPQESVTLGARAVRGNGTKIVGIRSGSNQQ